MLSRLKLASPLVVSSALVFHALCITLYNSPPNLVKLKYETAIDGYVLPYFYQTWSFFAPNPIDYDAFLLVRAKPYGAHSTLTSWYNVSLPYIEDLQHNRLSSKETIVSGLSNALLEGSQVFRNSIEKKTPIADPYKQEDLRILYRMAAAYLRYRFPERHFESIQVAIRTDRYPRFTRRQMSSEESSARDLTFPVIPFPNDIVAMPW